MDPSLEMGDEVRPRFFVPGGVACLLCRVKQGGLVFVDVCDRVDQLPLFPYNRG